MTSAHNRPAIWRAGGRADVEAKLADRCRYRLRGSQPGTLGVKTQLTAFCEAMISPIPPETSQLSVPACTACWADAPLIVLTEANTTAAHQPQGSMRTHDESPLLSQLIQWPPIVSGSRRQVKSEARRRSGRR